VNHVQSIIPQLAPQESDEVAVRFQRHEHGIRAHLPENLLGECAHSWSILEKDASPFPVHFGQYVVDQET